MQELLLGGKSYEIIRCAFVGVVAIKAVVAVVVPSA